MFVSFVMYWGQKSTIMIIFLSMISSKSVNQVAKCMLARSIIMCKVFKNCWAHWHHIMWWFLSKWWDRSNIWKNMKIIVKSGISLCKFLCKSYLICVPTINLSQTFCVSVLALGKNINQSLTSRVQKVAYSKLLLFCWVW